MITIYGKDCMIVHVNDHIRKRATRNETKKIIINR